MKKFILLILICCLFYNVFGQSAYPFEVKISGKGTQNIVLIPGLSCPGDVWTQTLDRYNKDHTCYTLTFHGFAGVAADSTTSYANWEKEIARYIKENKISKPVIIGHSIGGGMAMLLAADYPELIGKIVVVDALPCLAALSNPSFVADKNPDCSSFIKQLQSMSTEQYYQMQQMTIPSLMNDTLHQAQAIGWSVRSDRKAIAEIYCQFFNTDMREKLSTVKCPALVLLESPFVNAKPAIEEQFKGMKQANLQYSGKALHFIMYDDTDWYLSQVDIFLK
jgi:pimeloyl-ACP methyl ester carboxylesterase